MAKRKTHRRRRSHSVTTRRRRRVGAVLGLKAGSPLVKFGSLAAGYLLSDKVHEQLDKILPDSTADASKTKIVNGILAAGGLYFLFMAKGKKSVFVEALAGIAAGVGAKGLLMDFGILSGFRSMPVLNGFNDVPVIGSPGYNVPAPSLNGMGSYAVPSGVVGAVPEYADGGSGINDTDR